MADSLQRLGINQLNHKLKVKKGGIEVTNGNISGSSTSTGSFGKLEVAGNSTLTGDITIGGNMTLGDADTDSINITADLTSNLIPNADSTYNIGSASMADGGYPLKIGTSTNTSNSEYAHFTGYMDGIRISKGVARYTTRFTKPSEPFVSDDNKSFLLNGSVLTDESSNSISITNSGDTSILANLDTTFANDGTVSGSPSIRFLPEGTTAGKDTLSFPLQDTTADVLSLHDPAYFEIPQNADFAFGAKDFTVEFWINIKELETGVLIGNTWEVHTRKGWRLYWNKVIHHCI